MTGDRWRLLVTYLWRASSHLPSTHSEFTSFSWGRAATHVLKCRRPTTLAERDHIVEALKKRASQGPCEVLIVSMEELLED